MITNVLCSIRDLQAYPIIALIMFLFVFTGSIVRALAMQRDEAAARGRMPLEDTTSDNEGERE